MYVIAGWQSVFKQSGLTTITLRYINRQIVKMVQSVWVGECNLFVMCLFAIGDSTPLVAGWWYSNIRVRLLSSYTSILLQLRHCLCCNFCVNCYVFNVSSLPVTDKQLGSNWQLDCIVKLIGDRLHLIAVLLSCWCTKAVLKTAANCKWSQSWTRPQTDHQQDCNFTAHGHSSTAHALASHHCLH